MVYSGVRELPEAVRTKLPLRAQKIYQAAFNTAWDNYRDPEDREGGSREETAHKVAWSAVKHKYYKKENNRWALKVGE
ncbi:MAG: ChaB family protein [Methylophilus sp.]|jgi:cation transport regulator